MNPIYRTPQSILEAADVCTPPTRDQLDALRPGDFVKIGVAFDPQGHVLNLESRARVTGERFWVHLTDANHAGDQFKGFIDNHLVYGHIHGLKADDKVAFCRRHILDVVLWSSLDAASTKNAFEQ